MKLFELHDPILYVESSDLGLKTFGEMRFVPWLTGDS